MWPDRYDQLFHAVAATMYGKSPGKGTSAPAGERFCRYTHGDQELCLSQVLVYVIVLVDFLFP